MASRSNPPDTAGGGVPTGDGGSAAEGCGVPLLTDMDGAGLFDAAGVASAGVEGSAAHAEIRIPTAAAGRWRLAPRAPHPWVHVHMRATIGASLCGRTTGVDWPILLETWQLGDEPARFELLEYRFESARTAELLANVPGVANRDALLEQTRETYKTLGAAPSLERVDTMQ